MSLPCPVLIPLIQGVTKMAKYTTELKWLLEAGFDIGLTDYPIFRESYREGLNQKIIDHYYFREIGFETAGLFKFMLNRKMREIMPYFNQLYLSAEMEIEPFITYDMETDYTKKNDDTTSDDATSTVDTNTNQTDTSETDTSASTTVKYTNTTANKQYSSTTPMGKLDDIFSKDYASESGVTDSTSTDSGNSTDTGNQHATGTSKITGNSKSTDSRDIAYKGNETFTKHEKGKRDGKSYSELLLEYRKTLINIDTMVLDELNSLFMGIY